VNLWVGSSVSGHGGDFKTGYSDAWTERSKSNSLLTFGFAMVGGAVLGLWSGVLRGVPLSF
jgi:hypothetical protein